MQKLKPITLDFTEAAFHLFSHKTDSERPWDF